ncbi:unnamed protein product, partial [Didymodactylos carnosus]
YTGDVMFIDYEDMDFNFPGYDIGKLMLQTLYEQVTNNLAYKLKSFDHFPSDEDLLDFIQVYLSSRYHRSLNKDLEFQSIQTEQEKEIEQLLEQVKIGAMIAGYYSALFGMRVGRNPNIHFDFVQFAIDGFKVYEEFKRRIYY